MAPTFWMRRWLWLDPRSQMATDAVLERLKGRLAEAEASGAAPLWTQYVALRLLAKARAHVITRAIVERSGLRVLGGPFQGMVYVDGASEGSLAARLLGVYEAELHPHLEAVANDPPPLVVNIGCAEGYYAVGLARRLPSTVVHAFDIDPAARDRCRALAESNGVADRVLIGERMDGERFAEFPAGSLVVVDIEGGEADLLDPVRFPGLTRLKIIVETHPQARSGVTELLEQRFGASHQVTRVETALHALEPPAWLRDGDHLDLLLATWEWRTAATPWLVMTPMGG